LWFVPIAPRGAKIGRRTSPLLPLVGGDGQGRLGVLAEVATQAEPLLLAPPAAAPKRFRLKKGTFS
jgi:hypothetical protein